MSAPENRIDLFSFKTPAMRAFHMSWSAFLLTFFGWFGVAPLMPIIREEMHLTKQQIGNTVIASVAATIFVRLLIGWVCDRVGPRRTYAALLIIGSIPVMTIGLAHDYTSFLLFRLAIGGVGASFVITQYHASVMFAPNVVGRAAATTAGWGNLGGGVAQIATPLLMSAFMSLGISQYYGWRLAMVVPGLLMLVWGFLYYRLTQDYPAGNVEDGVQKVSKYGASQGNTFLEACRDYRVWALFLTYASCFGIELTFHNMAALYFADTFSLSLTTAGLIAGSYGLMNLFARWLGGAASDRVATRFGLRGRVLLLGILLVGEGAGLVLFAQMRSLPAAIVAMVVFALFTKMASGGTYAVVPFLNRRALGSVAGIIGAGGNFGAVIAGLLFREDSLSMSAAFTWLGVAVAGCASLTLLVRFSPEKEESERQLLQDALTTS
ncbi:MAG: major facilitator superfamily 1 [Myxococcaceae bacterium]|nr:major facilitator superfamily 1 [Myxococcaceae bacterium]